MCSTWQELTPRTLAWRDAPIGSALPHVDVELRADGRPVADGRPGRSFPPGGGIVDGYLGRPELTEHGRHSGEHRGSAPSRGRDTLRAPRARLHSAGRPHADGPDGTPPGRAGLMG